MLDHLGLEVSDLDASVEFFTQALAPLGVAPIMRVEGVACVRRRRQALGVTMDLHTIQKPIKERYRSDPEASLVTLTALVT